MLALTGIKVSHSTGSATGTTAGVISQYLPLRSQV